MIFPNKETVERIRQEFPVGCRIVLDAMQDPYTTLQIGAQGSVVAVDDVGTVHVSWDCGSSLGIAYGADRAHRVATEGEARVTLDHLGKGQRKGGFCPRCGAEMPGSPFRYALSRRANIQIGNRCGQEEALEDARLTDRKLPLMQWKALTEMQNGGGPWKG